MQKIFEPRRTPQQYMLVAVSDADPDRRREAVARVAESKQHQSEWAIKGFVAIALLEDDAQARCVAVRALGLIRDPRAVDALLKILNHERHPPEGIAPPSDLCRWDAAETLASVCGEDYAADRASDIRETFIARLESDRDRHVRIAAARGLACFQDERGLEALIAALRDEDFAVVHQCEESLVALTGVTHGADAFAWERWREQNQAQPFAGAGHTPASRRKPYDTRLGKFAYDTRQVARWLFPGRKE